MTFSPPSIWLTKKMTDTVKISAREALANKIADWLRDCGKATAPYGVMVRKESSRNCYVVTFGVARYLDATVEIWGDKFYRIRGAGPLVTRCPAIEGYGEILRDYNDLIRTLSIILSVK